MNTRKTTATGQVMPLFGDAGSEAPAPNGADPSPRTAPTPPPAAAAARSRKTSIFRDAEALIALTNAKLGEVRQVSSIELVLGRPKKTWYFRTPVDTTQLFCGSVWEDPDDKTIYYVSPDLWDLDDFEGALKPCLFAPFVTADGTIHGVWPLGTQVNNTYNSSAMRILEESRSQWLRMWTVQAKGIFRRQFAQRDYGEPKFLDMSIHGMLEQVFTDREILDEDHPVIARLRGQL
jgi:hypothetical protein